MIKYLLLAGSLVVAGCGGTPQSSTEVMMGFKCALDATGTIVSVVDTNKAPINGTAVAVLTGVGNLAAVGATDPACAVAIASIIRANSRTTTSPSQASTGPAKAFK